MSEITASSRPAKSSRPAGRRITGVAADADEVVQDAWLRWQRCCHDSTGDPISNPAGWLTTVVGRLALDRLRSARRRRERYVGPWLPEPVDIDPLHGRRVVDPESASLLAESLSLGFMAVLERLAPVERVVFLLHDVFAMPFTEIAELVERTPATTRQIAARARKRVRSERPRFAPEPADLDELTARFLHAAYGGDPADLQRLLADDVVLVADAGPDRRAARAPIIGPHRVGRYLVGLAKRFQPGGVDEHVEQELTMIRVNGQPALAISVDGELDTVVTTTWVDGLVTSVQMLRNPDKLEGSYRRHRPALSAESHGDRKPSRRGPSSLIPSSSSPLTNRTPEGALPPLTSLRGSPARIRRTRTTGS